MGKSLRNEDQNELEKIGSLIEDFLTELNEIGRITDRIKLSKAFDNILKSWEKRTDELYFDRPLEDFKEKKLNKIKEMETNWQERFTIIPTDSVKVWTAEFCVKWLEETKVPPDYLSEVSLEKYYNLRNVVQKRLDETSIEGVVTLFKNLLPEQQHQCLKIINPANPRNNNIHGGKSISEQS
ncbi:MAG: hypothetical protein M0021_00870 [Clostridia bacterium]|nr:hypothetical protein [Clostridia bacterium]